MTLISRVIKDWFTGIDGESYDVGKALWVLASVQFCILAGWAIVVNKQPFNALEYGGGLGLVLAAGGAAISLKAKTEPEGPPAQKSSVQEPK